MCRKRMPQRMRTDVFLQLDLFGQVLYYGKNHCTRQLPPAPVQKQSIFKSFLNGQMIAYAFAIEVNEPLCLRANRHEALLIAFSRDLDEAFIEEQVRYFKRNQFGNTQSASV